MTKLHAGGKFDSNSLQSLGRPARRRRELRERAVGSAAARNLARRRVTWEQEYAQGHSRRRRWRRPARPDARPAPRSPSSPTRSIMDATKFNFDTLAQRLRELAFLNKGLTITLTDEREDPPRASRVSLQRRHRRVHQAPEQGQERAAREADLLRRRARAAQRRTLTMEVALQYNDTYSEIGVQLRQQHQHRRRRHRT